MFVSLIFLAAALLLQASTKADTSIDGYSPVNLANLGSKTRDGIQRQNVTLTKSYIVQLRPGASLNSRDAVLDPHAHFHKRAAEASISYSTTFVYQNTDLFYGLSINLANADDLAKISDLDPVARVFPVRQYARPAPVHAVPGSHHQLKKRFDPNINSPLQMTGVDKLHRRGIKGKGVKIAIIDTGVDYTLKALGGCFGKGCKISFGYDFVGDAYGDTGGTVPGPDPLTTCAGGGHGTHVAGIIGMDEKDGEGFGLQGVAPEADLGMYKVFGCEGGTQDDVMIAAFDKAIKDGADIISISIGALQNWQSEFYPYDPLPAVVDNIAAMGIGFIAAAGNNGDSGVFTLNSPGVARGSVGVGYVENAQFPTTYQATDSLGNTIHYGSILPIRNATGGMEIILLGNGTVASQQNCVDQAAYNKAAANVKNFSTVALAIRRGGVDTVGVGCAVTTSIGLAQAANFTNVLILSDITDSDINWLGYVLPEPQANPDGSLMQIFSTATDASKVFAGLSTSSSYQLFFNNTSLTQLVQPGGGFVGNFSSRGPSYEFAMKPDVVAPGGSILSTWVSNQGGYAVLTGTSMATPHVAGVYALIKSHMPSLKRDDIVKILQTTSSPLNSIYRNDVQESIAAQGGGLVNAFVAVLSVSTVSPGKMELLGTESLTSQNITISNPSNAPVTYKIGHSPAGLLYSVSYPNITGWHGSGAGNPVLPIYATTKLSTTEVTIPAGGSSTIQVTFEPPNGLDARQIPIYSGYITITSPSDTHSIPYIGAAYDRSIAKILETSNLNGGHAPIIASYNNNSKIDTGFMAVNLTSDLVTINFLNYQYTLSGRFDIVPANTTFVPDVYGYDPSVKYTPSTAPGQPVHETIAGLDIVGMIINLKYWLPDADFTFTWFSGLTANDNSVNLGVLQPGDYRIVIRFLKFDGDVTEEKDYESWMSGVLQIL